MKRILLLISVLLLLLLFLSLQSASAQSGGEMAPGDHARVFITDSQSWELSGGGGGNWAGFGQAASGGARPQTAEIIKTFAQRCPDVITNNIQGKADYIVLLDHEGGKGWAFHRNKVAVFARVSGDSVVSKSTYSLGASVQTACDAIHADWEKNSARIHQAEAAESAAKDKPASPQPVQIAQSNVTKMSVTSNPGGADIEVDGSFVGNSPSTIDLAPGDHAVKVTKTGFKDWERKLKASGGNVNLNVELEAQTK